MSHATETITVDPNQCGGRPCIRGMRIRVTDILDLLAAGLTFGQILDEMPDLVHEDIVAALKYASRGIDHLTEALGLLDSGEALVEIQ